jgi:dipeptidase E
MRSHRISLPDPVVSFARKSVLLSFVPTASGDSESYIEAFYGSFKQLAAVPSHLQLFRLTIREKRAFLLQQDVIYVGGGNTFNMLLIWKERGIDSILRQAAENGTLLCGLSAEFKGRCSRLSRSSSSART